MALLALSIVVFVPSCIVAWKEAPVHTNETDLVLRQGNFVTSKVHAVGSATRRFVFFTGVAGPPDTLSAAWKAMKESAEIEGKAAQFVNVTEQRTTRWMVVPFYYQVTYTVSADVIAFE